MNDKRTLKFYYFKPFLYKDGKKNRAFNFADWIINFENADKIYETISLSSIMARVDGHKYDKVNDLHGVCFVNMRGENLPSKVAEGKEQEDLDLEESEYIGEDMYVLYDRTNNVFMAQSNRMALTINRITEFVNRTKDLNDYMVVGFVPVTRNLSRKELKNKKVRSILISCENLHEKDKMESSALKSICDSADGFGCLTYSLKLGVGRKRNAELSPAKSQKMIDDIINRAIDVKSAQVSIADQLTGELEYVDLIQNKVCSILEYKIGKRERLQLSKLFPVMVAEYLKIKSKNYF